MRHRERKRRPRAEASAGEVPRAERAVSLTERAALAAALGTNPRSARELGQALSLDERDVIDHLLHLERSLAGEGARLAVTPPSCKKCGYVFEGRGRLTRPSRCPECKGERIAPALFQIVRA
jgi:predicted Zn-ribbon and HTH transcriptional regulator